MVDWNVPCGLLVRCRFEHDSYHDGRWLSLQFSPVHFLIQAMGFRCPSQIPEPQCMASSLRSRDFLLQSFASFLKIIMGVRSKDATHIIQRCFARVARAAVGEMELFWSKGNANGACPSVHCLHGSPTRMYQWTRIGSTTRVPRRALPNVAHP